MKKTFLIILVLTTILSLCACGSSGGSGNSVGAAIDFESPSQDFSISIETFDEVPTHAPDISLPAFDFDFTIEPFQVTNDIVSFEFADYDYSIDANTFDVEQFAAESSENFSDEVKTEIAEMDVQKVVAIAETRANLLADLSHAFKSADLPIVINEERGEIMLDSSVLFESDKAELSAEDKLFLQKFLTVYTTIVYNPKYEGFLSQVLVEGHTDSDGDYDYNLALSQNRADNVRAFCLSKESGVEAYAAELESSLEAIGYSYDRLIYDANGNEDKDASRRVSFRFLIALPDE